MFQKIYHLYGVLTPNPVTIVAGLGHLTNDDPALNPADDDAALHPADDDPALHPAEDDPVLHPADDDPTLHHPNPTQTMGFAQYFTSENSD